MDLTTKYLGLELRHPFMPGASPLADDLEMVRRLEDAGAAAIVLRSLFEEQITGEQLASHHSLDHPGDSFAEALSYTPDPEEFVLGPDEYLEQVRRIKAAVHVPVIASLNGTTASGWLEYALLIEDAGADALELNIYQVATDPARTAAEIEADILEMVRAVVGQVEIPVAVKLSPFYTALTNFARQLDRTGVRGLVLFNRFYQPEIDAEELQVRRQIHLSTSAELPLRLTWLAILSPKLKASLAVTGGVHSVIDAVQSIMAGAHAIQLVSALLKRGPAYLATLRQELAQWLEEHEYHSLRQAQGSMNLAACPDPQVYSRANYMLVLQSWRTSS